ARSATAHIDRAAPTTTDNVPSGTVLGSVTVTLTATDTGGAGVDKTYYTTDGSEPTTSSPVYNPASKPVLTSDGQVIAYFSTDNVGNQENVEHSSAAKVDSVTGVTSGATYTLGSVPPATCLDPTATVSLAGKVGKVTATCTDAAGAVSVTYTVAYCAT